MSSLSGRRERTLRVGALGVAAIVTEALVEPARRIDGVEVAAVASREPARAQVFAEQHGIARAYGGYEELLADESLDAIYIPLPPALHARWTVAALEAGHHVLCEKPFASNAAQARMMVEAAIRADRKLVEAFHWRYHPLADRVIDIARSIGPLLRAEAHFDASMPTFGFRRDIELGGGVMMDVGCYPVHWLRTIDGGEPSVVSAEAVEDPEGIDVTTRAELDFPSGLAATVRASMVIGPPLTPECAHIRLEGERGELHVTNPMAPHMGHRVQARLADGDAVDETFTLETTYHFQLEAFRRIVAGEREQITGGADAVANMATIDAIYTAAGLSPRR